MGKNDGKISFAEMGKIIGKRWKDITKEKKEIYNNLASHDTDRYKAEMHKYNGKQEEIRVKNKRSAELQFAQMVANNAQMAATQAQQASMMPPSMIKYSETQASQPDMYPAQMGYPAPPYSNAPYGYQHLQMGMMGACNPYYMSMQPNNMDGNLPANGDLPDTETSANNSYPPPFPPTQINHQNSYLQNYLHQQQPNEYHQSNSMP